MVDAPWEETSGYPKVQIAFFLGTDRNAPQMVFRGNDVQDVRAQLEKMAEKGPDDISVSDEIFSIVAEIDAVAKLKFNLGTTAKSDGFTPANAKPWGENAAPSDDGTHTCVHGKRIWKTGTSSAGKAYQGWMCPSRDRNNQCKPEWVN